MIIAHGTHPGETGKNNEDRYGVTTFGSQTDGAVTLAMVADGIGGHRAGEVAAELAVQTITGVVAQSPSNDYRAALESAVTQAAQAIAERARSGDRFFGMGTTCAVALVAAGRLYIAYVGDSRIYLIRGGVIRQISVDHTFVQEAIEHGLFTPAEARQHPQRHVLRRHLGASPEVKADFRLRLADDESAELSEKNQSLRLEPGDALLLCSDGLSDLVEEAEILDAVLKHAPQAAVDELIALARKRGGYDNITVVVMKEEENANSPSP